MSINELPKNRVLREKKLRNVIIPEQISSTIKTLGELRTSLALLKDLHDFDTQISMEIGYRSVDLTIEDLITALTLHLSSFGFDIKMKAYTKKNF